MTGCAIFDLDGTLLDSAPLCAEIINQMREARGASEWISTLDARRWVSLGASNLVSSLLGDVSGDPERDVAEFRRQYNAMATPRDSLFPGVLAGLEKLHSSGVALGICSNKPQMLCEKVVGELGMAPFFGCIVGGSANLAPKPDPEGLRLAMFELGSFPGRACYVGDSDLDYLASLDAGIACVIVSYGYAPDGYNFEGAHLADNFGQAVDTVFNLLTPAGAPL